MKNPVFLSCGPEASAGRGVYPPRRPVCVYKRECVRGVRMTPCLLARTGTFHGRRSACPPLPVPLDASRTLTGSQRRPRLSLPVALWPPQTPGGVGAVAWTPAERFSCAPTRKRFGVSCLLPSTGRPRAPLSACLPPPVGVFPKRCGPDGGRGDRCPEPLCATAGRGWSGLPEGRRPAPGRGVCARTAPSTLTSAQRRMLPATFISCRMIGERWLLLLIHTSLPTNFLCSWRRSRFLFSNICSPDSPGPDVRQLSGLPPPAAQPPSAPASVSGVSVPNPSPCALCRPDP